MGSYWGTMIWNANTGAQIRMLPWWHMGNVASVAVFPDGSQVVAGGGSTVSIWCSFTGNVLHAWHLQGSVTSVAVFPDGSKVVTGSTDHTVAIWDVSTDRVLQSLRENQNVVTSVAVFPDGSGVVTGSSIPPPPSGGQLPPQQSPPP